MQDSMVLCSWNRFSFFLNLLFLDFLMKINAHVRWDAHETEMPRDTNGHFHSNEWIKKEVRTRRIANK